MVPLEEPATAPLQPRVPPPCLQDGTGGLFCEPAWHRSAEAEAEDFLDDGPPRKRTRTNAPAGGNASQQEGAPLEEAPLLAATAARVDSTVMALARSIRRIDGYVGYSAFVLFALHYGRRPMMWEGESLVDVVEAFAPWAAGDCATACKCEGVACVLVPSKKVGRVLAERPAAGGR